MNILLLEDEDALSKIAKLQMEDRGHTVLIAGCLEEAREHLSTNTLDILVADHEVPDGFGARFAIETKGKYPDMKIMVVSGRLLIHDIEELEAHGITYFDKPLLYADAIEQL